MKPMNERKVVLIIGASSGIGRACAVLLSKEGYTVFGTSRKKNDIVEDIIDGQKIWFLPMDVTIPHTIHQGVSQIIQLMGKIDVLIYSVGISLAGPIEETNDNETLLQFDTNFFGAHRVVKTVIPYMRENKNGIIIFISSLAGEFGLPFQSFYSASKAALNNFAESLQIECPFLKVVVIEPGDYNTSLPDNRIIVKGHKNNSVYEKFQLVIKRQEELERHGADPDEIAQLITKIIKNPSKFYYRIGKNAKLVSILGKILPRRLVIKQVAKHYGL
jgi:short-subunit dehydrogenase